MKNKMLFMVGFVGIMTFALTHFANFAELFGKFSAIGCVTGLSEIPVPESLKEE